MDHIRLGPMQELRSLFCVREIGLPPMCSATLLRTARHGVNIEAFMDEPTTQVATDEPGGAGDENATHERSASRPASIYATMRLPGDECQGALPVAAIASRSCLSFIVPMQATGIEASTYHVRLTCRDGA
jgi:hypothetical protein